MTSNPKKTITIVLPERRGPIIMRPARVFVGDVELPVKSVDVDVDVDLDNGDVDLTLSTQEVRIVREAPAPAEPEPAEPDRGAWRAYRHADAFLDALATGGRPRAAWQALPGAVEARAVTVLPIESS